MTPLLIACEKGQTLAVITLAKAGANLNAKTKPHAGEHTALHFAVHSGKFDLVRLLVQLGVEIDAKNNQGQSPLEMSSQITIGRGRNNPIRSFLLAHGAIGKCYGEGCKYCRNEMDDLCEKLPDLLDD